LAQLLSGSRFAVTHHAGSAPDLVILDAGGPAQGALDLLRAAKSQHPTSRVVAVASEFDLGLIQLLVSAGVDSFCLTTSRREVLIKIFELTLLGERVLPATVVQSVVHRTATISGASHGAPSADQQPSDPKARKLSPRETVILQSIMGGDANKVIARKLDVTEATVKVHVKSILRKIGAVNRTQAAMWANENLRAKDRPVIMS
jgi:two-component system nitrate/nitrite response regulator NarL